MIVLPATLRQHVAELERQIGRASQDGDSQLRMTLEMSKAVIEQLGRERQPVDALLDSLRLWRWQRGTMLNLDARIDPTLPLTRDLIDAALNTPYGTAAPRTVAHGIDERFEP